MASKAHTVVVRRLAAKFDAIPLLDGVIDIETPTMLVAVETSATLPAGVELLKAVSGRRFVAVTNREAIADALQLVDGTGIGVMNPMGEIVREAAGGPCS